MRPIEETITMSQEEDSIERMESYRTIIPRESVQELFKKIPGDVLNLIAEMMIPEDQLETSRVPDFVQTNKTSYKGYINHRIESYQVQQMLLKDQIEELKEGDSQTSNSGRTKKFKLPKDLEQLYNRTDFISMARKIIDEERKVTP